MKKFIAILMTILMIVAVTVVSASAATSAETEVSVNKGDEVIYSLKLTVPEKVVGCDFSVYFDSSVLQVQEVADFTGSFDEDEHRAVINPNLKDEVIGNWSILNGVAFDNKSMVTVKFKAMAKADTHIKYYIRYLYPESLEQFTTYTFKCDVQVNGKDVVKDAAPELNVKDEQSQGLFINSVTGDSNDANVNMAEKTPSNNGDISENDYEKSTDKPNSNNNNNNSNNDKDAEKSTEKSSENSDTNTSISENGGVSSPDSVTASPSQTGEDGGIFTSIWFWIVIVLIVAGGGIGAFVVYKKKNTETE